MAFYLQMGHDSKNLIGETDLEEMTGIVLSPVNETTTDLSTIIDMVSQENEFRIIFDPQLYYPHSHKGKLGGHPYYPENFITNFGESTEWWTSMNASILEYALSLGVNTILSPLRSPREWNSSYLKTIIDTGNNLITQSEGKLSIIQTVLMNIDSISGADNENRRQEFASVLMHSEADEYALIFQIGGNPRHEIRIDSEIYGMMDFIRLLRNTGKKITVLYCHSFFPLLHLAGADNFTSGKFFNLRSFSPGRWDENDQAGGGQTAWWFEQGLLAFLREGDILKLISKGHPNLIGNGFSNSSWSSKILPNIQSPERVPWVADSWRQWLSWFGKMEHHLSQEKQKSSYVWDLLNSASQNWNEITGHHVYMSDNINDGGWISAWRQALADFESSY